MKNVKNTQKGVYQHVGEIFFFEDFYLITNSVYYSMNLIGKHEEPDALHKILKLN